MDTVKVAPDNFGELFFMRAMPRKEFTQDARRAEDKPQKKTRDGVPVWSVQVTGIDWRGNMQPLTVTIPTYDNPSASFTPGEAVELVGLVFGVSPKRDGGGFVTWCSADELRPAATRTAVKAVAS